MRDDDGSQYMVEANEETIRSFQAMFFIRLIKDSIGQEAVIQIGYMGLKTLVLDRENKQPKLQSSEVLEEIPTGGFIERVM